MPGCELSHYRSDNCLVVDSWFAEEIRKADHDHRAPDETAILTEAVGLIALRAAANPTKDSSVSTVGDLLPLLDDEQTPTFGSLTSPERLITLGWEAAIVRAFLPRLSRQMGFPAQDPTIRPADLPRSTARSTLSWLVGNALDCALQDPALGGQPKTRPLWSPFDLSPGADLAALVIYRRSSNPDRLVKVLAERIAEQTRCSTEEVSHDLLLLARDAATGFSREELSRDLGRLLWRTRTRAPRFI